MITLKLYGTGSATADYIAKNISLTLNKAGIDFRLEKVNKVDLFISNKIESIPAIQLNDKIYYFNQEGLLSVNLRLLLQQILKVHDYGIMPKIYCHVNSHAPSIEAIIYSQKLATFNKGMLKLTCSAPIDIKVNKSLESQFYKLVNAVESEWASDIFSSAIIEANFINSPFHETIEKHIMNDKPIYSILPHINRSELKKYQNIAAPFGKVLNEIPKDFSVINPMSAVI